MYVPVACNCYVTAVAACAAAYSCDLALVPYWTASFPDGIEVTTFLPSWAASYQWATVRAAWPKVAPTWAVKE